MNCSLPPREAADISNTLSSSRRMLRAIIFDFNGIILNDEPLHFSSMRDVVATFGITLSAEDYWNRYLPFNDEHCLKAVCQDRGLELTSLQRDQALKEKSRLYHERLQNRYPLFPGAADFVRAASQQYPLAIASGAQKADIEETLRVTNLQDCFRCVVAAEDFKLGKPHPESFLTTLERLNIHLDGLVSPIQPRECLVIEDAVAGVQGARAAGMVCLAVSNSYPRERLSQADRVVPSLEALDLASLQILFEDKK